MRVIPVWCLQVCLIKVFAGWRNHLVLLALRFLSSFSLLLYEQYFYCLCGESPPPPKKNPSDCRKGISHSLMSRAFFTHQNHQKSKGWCQATKTESIIILCKKFISPVVIIHQLFQVHIACFLHLRKPKISLENQRTFGQLGQVHFHLGRKAGSTEHQVLD